MVADHGNEALLLNSALLSGLKESVAQENHLGRYKKFASKLKGSRCIQAFEWEEQEKSRSEER